MSQPIKLLIGAFDDFYGSLDAATVPAANGSRKVGGIAHAVLISEETDKLYSAIPPCRHGHHGRAWADPPLTSRLASCSILIRPRSDRVD